MSGALLDPHGHAVTITESEHQALHSHLEIMRSADLTDRYHPHDTMIKAAIALYRIESTSEPKGWHPLAWVARSLIDDGLVDDERNATGVLVNTGEFGVEPLQESEVETLWNTLKTLRGGGWFADWLAMQVHFTGGSDEPACKYPAPLTIMGTLVDAIDAYDKRSEIVREMVEMRPDVFAPVPKPAAPEGESVPAPKPRLNRKRTRKAA